MRQKPVRFRNIGIKGPKNTALRPVTWPLELGACHVWITDKPRGIHIAMKRGILLGRLVLRSFILPEKVPVRGGSGSRPAKQRKYYSTPVRSLSQTINHGGATFTVGRINY